MRGSQAAAVMYAIIAVRDEINEIVSALDASIERVFAPVTIQIPRFKPAELGFIRSVSWLYLLYHEAGVPNVNHLKNKFDGYALDPAGNHKSHPVIVRQLRTFLQHNVGLERQSDTGLRLSCEKWFEKHCNTKVPGDAKHWNGCLFGLLRESEAFVTVLRECVRHIERDESRTRLLAEWKLMRDRFHPPHEYDSLIASVAADMGRESIDAVRIRKRFYSKWTRELESRVEDYHFEREARKLIEHTLITETTSVLPITGSDVINSLGVEPGARVGEVLHSARILYDKEPCGREELLRRLRNFGCQVSPPAADENT